MSEIHIPAQPSKMRGRCRREKLSVDFTAGEEGAMRTIDARYPAAASLRLLHNNLPSLHQFSFNHG
jgi:hypothetical protein